MEPVFDDVIGMWVMPEVSESQEERLLREASEWEVELRAQQVATEVAAEVAALEQQVEPEPHTDWVQWGNALLDEITLYSLTQVPVTRRRRKAQEAPDMTQAPWGILLAPDLPLGTGFHIRDIVALRGVCYTLRGSKSTAQLLTEILNHLGIRVRLGKPQDLFRLACRIFDELSFVHMTRAVAARAIGIRPDDPAAANLCCVAGSYALNRLLLLGDVEEAGDKAQDQDASTSCLSGGSSRYELEGLAGGRQSASARRGIEACSLGLQPPATGVDWSPGDIDIFVGCHGLASSRQSVAAFRALVEYAKSSCSALFHGTRSRKVRLPTWLWPTDMPESSESLPVKPSVHISSEYEGWGALPAAVEAAMSTRGQTYPRDVVLEYASMWPESLRGAIRQLQSTLGVRRPIRVERVAEIRPFECQQWETHGRPTASSGFGKLWPAPMKINIVQYSHTSATPLSSAAVVSAFDFLPSMVTMTVDRSLTPRFEASDEARRCILKRELGLSKHAFGPSVDGTRLSIEDAIAKQLARITKYQRYGFELKQPAARE